MNVCMLGTVGSKTRVIRFPTERQMNWCRGDGRMLLAISPTGKKNDTHRYARRNPTDSSTSFNQALAP